MSVYLVYRCYYNAPGERHVRRFEHDSVVDWLRSIWKPISNEDRAYRHAKKLLGGLDVALFGSLFHTIAEEELPPPESLDEVLGGFVNVYVEEEDHGPHHLQVLTEDDDNQVAVYLFDDHFRAAAPGLTDFLLLDGWELPDCGRLAPPAGEGFVYSVDLITESKYNLEDLSGGSRLDGARVPDLCGYVLTRPDEDELDYALRSLRRSLQGVLAAPGGEDAGFLAEIRDHPGEGVHWAAYSDWLEERGRPPAGLHLLEAALRASVPAGADESRRPALDRVKVTPHMAQACKHEGRQVRTSSPGPRDTYTQWIFFDDRWVAAHPTLADGLLRFAARWDVLSADSEEEEE